MPRPFDVIVIVKFEQCLGHGRLDARLNFFSQYISTSLECWRVFGFPRGYVIILSAVSMSVGDCRDEAGGQRLGVIGGMDDWWY